MNHISVCSPLLAGKELKDALTTLPPYDESIRNQSQSERLLALNQIFDIYYPSPMACEIYSKLYLAFIRAFNKKASKSAIQQSYQNKNMVRGFPYQGIIGGSDSFTIIGVSGIGKSTAISKAISLITKDEVLVIQGAKTIPFLIVQTPCDSSLKGLLLEILRTIDSTLQTKYYTDAIRSRATIDMLIGSVSQVCLNHICVLIVDEAQNVVASKNGKNLMNALVQLINNAGISLCFVGTPESNAFFESTFQLARRSVGLYYSNLPYDNYFRSLCNTVFAYQYTKYTTPLSESIIEWLYSHSNGVTAIVIGLIQGAQEIAIIEGSEQLCFDTLEKTYIQRLSMLHSYINEGTVNSTINHTRISTSKQFEGKESSNYKVTSFATIILHAQKEGGEIVEYLKSFIAIEEIPL